MIASFPRGVFKPLINRHMFRFSYFIVNINEIIMGRN